HDFELAIDGSDVVAEDETGSQVVLLEEEDEAKPARKGKKGKKADIEGETAGDVDLADVEVEDASAGAALRGVKGRAWPMADEDEEDERPTTVVAAKPVPWGALPAAVLFPAI